MKPPRKTKEWSLPSLNQDRPYRVGKGKPPVETRFKPGESGNPSGRQKGSKNRTPAYSRLIEIVLADAERPININEGERRITLSTWATCLRRLGLQAAGGNTGAMRQYAEIVIEAAREKERRHIEGFKDAIEYKAKAEMELKQCKKLGIEPPKLFPHPDQIILDFRNDSWVIVGPLSEKEEQESFAHYEEDRESSRELVQFLQDRLAKSEKLLLGENEPKGRRRFARDIKRDRELIGKLKRRAEELIKLLTPWGFTETRPLWDDLVSGGGDSNESEARPGGDCR